VTECCANITRRGTTTRKVYQLVNTPGAGLSIFRILNSYYLQSDCPRLSKLALKTIPASSGGYSL